MSQEDILTRITTSPATLALLASAAALPAGAFAAESGARPGSAPMERVAAARTKQNADGALFRFLAAKHAVGAALGILLGAGGGDPFHRGEFRPRAALGGKCSGGKRGCARKQSERRERCRDAGQNVLLRHAMKFLVRRQVHGPAFVVHSRTPQGHANRLRSGNVGLFAASVQPFRCGRDGA